MNKFAQIYKSDLTRYGSENIDRWNKTFHYYLRKIQTTDNHILSLYYRFRFDKIYKKHGVEISGKTSIGEGLYLGHPYNITINPSVILGKNINIHKGVTIGQENRGKRQGTPTIGNNVWIGINAIIVGNITIWNDVLIAPNSYVNCDIPEHSVVMGNPCIIKNRDNATEGYTNRIV